METIGQYELQHRLGSGAFATVWLGYDRGFDGHVAIKLLADNWVGQPDIVRRFVEEARLLWRAEDPRIVDVFTLGTLPSGQPWFAMEYADRGTLADRLGGRLGSLEDEVALIREMGRCVQAVHRLGAVHRDVKPANFLIRATGQDSHLSIPGLGPDEKLKIGDLGLAKVVAEASGFTVAAGSPLYMAPEQAGTSAEVSFASDIYALGICAWEVLAGTAPESGAVGASLRAIRPDVPPAVAAVVQRAIEPEADDRWQTVLEFNDALEGALAAHSSRVLGAATAGTAAASESTVRSPRVAAIVVLTALLIIAAIVAAFATRRTGPDLSEAPVWFELPDAIDGAQVEVSETDDGFSVVGVLAAGFVSECVDFLSDASSAGYTTVRDECSADEALASTRNAEGATAVMAQLSNGRVGWQFADPPS